MQGIAGADMPTWSVYQLICLSIDKLVETTEAPF